MRPGFFRAAAAAAALAVAATAPARADTVAFLTPASLTAPVSVDFGNSTSQSLAVGTIVTSPATGAQIYNFLDTYDFTLTSAANVGGFVGTLDFTDPSGTAVTWGISNLQLNLIGPGGVLAGWASTTSFTGAQEVFSVIPPSNVEAGTYELDVRGLLVGPSSAYSGTLTALTPTPLPPASPLLAGGLALMWLAVRRRVR